MGTDFQHNVDIESNNDKLPNEGRFLMKNIRIGIAQAVGSCAATIAFDSAKRKIQPTLSFIDHPNSEIDTSKLPQHIADRVTRNVANITQTVLSSKVPSPTQSLILELFF